MLAGAIVWFAPIGSAIERHCYAIVVYMIIGWAIRVADYWITGLIGCGLFWLLNVAPIKTAFSGFTTDTAWFTVGALLLGLLGVKSGLAQRLARGMIHRFARDHARLVFGLTTASLILTFIVPSGVARAVILSGFVLGILEVLGLEVGGRMARGLFLAATYSSSIFDKMILAGSASMSGRSLIATYGHVQISYVTWLIAFLPASLITVVVISVTTLQLFPADGALGDFSKLCETGRAGAQWSWKEGKALALFVLAIGLWLTESWHGVSPAMVGFGVGLLAAVPALGLLSSQDLRTINLPSFFFVGAALSMAAVMASSGAVKDVSGMLGQVLFHLPTNPAALYPSLYGLGFGAHLLLASELSMLGVSLPAILDFAILHHLDVPLIGMAWTFAAGPKLFVYQSAVLIVGASYGSFRPGDLLKFGLVITAVEAVVLTLLVLIYWPLIGLR